MVQSWAILLEVGWSSPGNKLLGSKWILKRKMKVDGIVDRYKARQKQGLDLFDTYSPVTKLHSFGC